MIRLARMLFYATASYAFFRIGYPEEGARGIYDAATVPLLLGGALGIFLLLKALDLGTRAVGLAIELGFAAGAFLYLGFTLPQANGSPPLSKFLAGQRPTRATARDGITRLGFDPASAPAQAVISLFPR